MTPTVKLRFVWRDGQIENNGSAVSQKAVRVLQQWWYSELLQQGEWRDVPLEPAAVPAPPKKEWVGLTEDEAQNLFRLCLGKTYDDFWRAIEAKLKEKNT
jgi:hypothetical protein